MSAVQIVTDALADINSSVSGTTNVSSYSAGSLTSTQVDTLFLSNNEMFVHRVLFYQCIEL